MGGIHIRNIFMLSTESLFEQQGFQISQLESFLPRIQKELL